MIKTTFPDTRPALLLPVRCTNYDRLAYLIVEDHMSGHRSYSGNDVAGRHPRMMARCCSTARPHAKHGSVSTRTSAFWGMESIPASGPSRSRKDNVDALVRQCVQVLALSASRRLVKLVHVALDGTKVKANASEAMSYQRMKEPVGG